LNNLKIDNIDREKLSKYLKKFYSMYPSEKFTVFTFVRRMKDRIKGKIIEVNGERKRVGTKQSIMPVIASTGVGKSYFGIMCSILYGRPFSLDGNISYMPKAKEVSLKMKKLDFSTFIVDEGAVSLRSFNWQNKEQQEVTMLAQTERFRANWYFINLPNYQELTKSIRDGTSEYRIFMPYRTDTHARVILQKKSKNFRNKDAWSDDFANKMYEKLERSRKEITNDDILKIERRLPNYVMDFMIPNLELILPDVCNEYNRLKQESREEEEEENNKPDQWKDIFPRKAIKCIYHDTLGLKEGVRITQEKLAKELGVSASTIRKFLD
jgi:predicted DNA binding protein